MYHIYLNLRRGFSSISRGGSGEAHLRFTCKVELRGQMAAVALSLALSLSLG